MPDAFISYSSPDEQLARFIHRHLETSGLNPFLAPVSIRPGKHWSDATLAALRSSAWVIFLASRTACESDWVQQEIGAAIALQKKLVPIVWDMLPSELPGWLANHQAINLRGSSIEDAQRQLTAVAEWIKSDKATGLLNCGTGHRRPLLGWQVVAEQ
jgi:hypothetical protein